MVVPSPAMSLVLEATSLASWAPMLWKGSSRSMSRAMVTPSLVIVGAPKGLGEDDVAALGAEGDFDGVGEGVDAVAEGLASVLVEEQCLGHVVWSPSWWSLAICLRVLALADRECQRVYCVEILGSAQG